MRPEIGEVREGLSETLSTRLLLRGSFLFRRSGFIKQFVVSFFLDFCLLRFEVRLRLGLAFGSLLLGEVVRFANSA